MPPTTRPHEKATDEGIIEPVEPKPEGCSALDPAEMSKIGEASRTNAVLPVRFHPQAEFGRDFEIADLQEMVSDSLVLLVTGVLTVHRRQLYQIYADLAQGADY